MSLTLQDVAKIAHLARLELTADQLVAFQNQLSAVLDYADMLNELDLDGIQPAAHAIARQNVMRPDVVEPGLSVEDVLYNATATADNQFLIQSVLDE